MNLIKDLLIDAAQQPRILESRDFRREVVQAIAQLSHAQDLEVSQVHEFMDQIRERSNTNPDNARVRQPADGDIFVFLVDTIQMSCLEVLSDDEYSWTSKLYPTLGGLQRKLFTYRPPDQSYNKYGHQEGHFKKNIYYRQKDQTCLIHYRGDHTAAQPKLKYRKGQDRLAAGWTIKQRILEVDPNRKMGPTEVLKKLKETYNEGTLSVGLPQSKDQVRYYQRQLEEQKKSLHSVNIPYLDRIFGQRYIINTSVGPHKSYYLVHNQAMANLNHMLETLNNTGMPLVMHFEAATVKCGNYHLSPLVYIHPQITQMEQTESEDGVVIPLVHLLHEDQSHETMDSFFHWFKDLMGKNCPRLLEQTKVLVVDREDLGQGMDNTHTVYSQDKLLKELEKYGRGKKLRKKKFYTRSISDLISCSNLEDYKLMRDRLFNSNRMWTSPEGKLISDYYKTKLEEAVIQRGGHWHLEDIGLAEGLNYKALETYKRDLKHLQTNLRQTVDITAVKLFSFESSLHNNVMAAYYNTGNIFAKSTNYFVIFTRKGECFSLIWFLRLFYIKTSQNLCYFNHPFNSQPKNPCSLGYMPSKLRLSPVTCF